MKRKPVKPKSISENPGILQILVKSGKRITMASVCTKKSFNVVNAQKQCSMRDRNTLAGFKNSSGMKHRPCSAKRIEWRKNFGPCPLHLTRRQIIEKNVRQFLLGNARVSIDTLTTKNIF